MCPTRWTARLAAINAVLKDYTVLIDQSYYKDWDEYGLKAGGLLNSLQTFRIPFDLNLSYVLFTRAEEVSRVLQAKDTCLQDALKAICFYFILFFYQSQRNESAFVQFYSSVVQTAEQLQIGFPKLPRYRRAPPRLEKRSHSHKYTTPEEFYRIQYFEALDLFVVELEDRFEQNEYIP